MRWPKLSDPIVIKGQLKTVNLIPLAILVSKVTEIIFRINNKSFTGKIDGGSTFASSFIEWFGVLYGLLLPLILVRVWEQLDAIDREFDREADAVKLLFEDIFYLRQNNAEYGKQIGRSLQEYVEHVIKNYKKEIKPDSTPRISEIILSNLSHIIKIENDTKSMDETRFAGDKILDKIRLQCKNMILTNSTNAKEPDPFVAEVFKGLYEVVDIRGDRIGYASQRLFQSLRIVALLTSITFVLPFYFVGFTPNTPPLDNILIVCVTVLVIFIYLIIEDFDEPFGGTWRIHIDSWENLLKHMKDHDQELQNMGVNEVSSSNTNERKTKAKSTLRKQIPKEKSKQAKQ